MKYILVTGGVISGIGKGVISSTIGTLLRCHGISITSIKIDPYINIDAGTFSPYEHGEVFVLDDGGEVDLDLGNYERFLDITLTSQNNITTGKIYLDVITNERKGNYLGKTVQVVPHITDAIQSWVEKVAKIPVDDTNNEPNVCVIELGGTIGDIESMPFVEAFRQFQFKVLKENFCVVHVSLIPQLSSGEQKTKPTQASVRELRGLGLTPDFIVARCVGKLLPSVIEKLAHFCHVSTDQILALPDISNIFKVPILLEEQNFVKQLLINLNIPILSFPLNSKFFNKWKSIAQKYEDVIKEVVIALVGKYTQFEDSYTSILKALQYASLAANYKLKIQMIESIKLEDEHKSCNPNEYDEAWQLLKNANGILIPGGFGERGILGKILAIKYARENKKPLLGICLGMQLSLVEIARNLLGMNKATSAEFLEIHDTNHILGTNLKSPTKQNPNDSPIKPKIKENDYDIIIKEMPEFNPLNKGGTMRLGKRVTLFKNTYSIHKGSDCSPPPYISIVRKLYGDADLIEERHRHRYEFNTKYKKQFEDCGLHFVGEDETGERMEIIELEDHPFFVGTQFHPEYKTRPLKPSPIYYGFILAAIGKLNTVLSDMSFVGGYSPLPVNSASLPLGGTLMHEGGVHVSDTNTKNSPPTLPPLINTPNSQHSTNQLLLLLNDIDKSPNSDLPPPNQHSSGDKGDTQISRSIKRDISKSFIKTPSQQPLISDGNSISYQNFDAFLHPRYVLSNERMFSPEKAISVSNPCFFK